MAKSLSAPELAQLLQQGLDLHQQGHLDEAEKFYNRVLKAQRDQFDALHLLGMLNHQRGRNGEAYRLISSALKVDPRSADALTNLALVLHALKRDEEALASLERALALAPGHVEALNNRGNLLLELKRPADALTAFEAVLARDPRNVQARINQGNALAEIGQGEPAVAAYDIALAIDPHNPLAHYNRGNALRQLARYADAIGAYDRAVAAMPGHASAWYNRALALQALNRHEEALASATKAVALQKDHADAHFAMATSLLTLGDYRRGFEAYEWRWQATGRGGRRGFRQPQWAGDYALGNRTILLHAEQGLGDTIQFARYAPLIARTGARVLLEVQPELKALLSGLEGVTAVYGRGEALPAFDVHCPLASLPLAFKTQLATVPAHIPYLRAGAASIAKWRPRLEAFPSPRVALAWAGRATHVNDRNRSIALSQFSPLLSVPGVSFIGVQRELRGEDAALLAQQPQTVQLGEALADFTDTAAVLALADLVISVDTSVAHLAAAMGRPTWILLPFQPDWRWTLEREASPWYPAARLFRQPAPGDWDSVLRRVSAELASQHRPVT